MKYYFSEGFSNQVKPIFKTSPVIYYSYRLSKKMTLRINFQYFFIQANQYLKQNIDNPFLYYYTIKQNIINTNLGIEHTLYNKKNKQFYWGVEVNHERGIQTEVGKGHLWFSGFTYDFYIDTKTKYLMAGLNGLIGTKINILKNVNAKIEASLFITDGFGIRPINRLSLNYQF